MVRCWSGFISVRAAPSAGMDCGIRVWQGLYIAVVDYRCGCISASLNIGEVNM